MNERSDDRRESQRVRGDLPRSGGSCGDRTWSAARDQARDVEDELDRALEIFASTGPEFGGGLANHGPMAAEALRALGRPRAIVPWSESYAKRLEPLPMERERIERSTIAAALGDSKRTGDWIAFFERELAERPWREVLDEWVARLTPSIVAVAFHGVIRAGHAVRALAARENEPRRRELAHALAYWAANRSTLTTRRSPNARPNSIDRALRALPTQRPARTPPGGFIMEGMLPLDGDERFAESIDWVDDSIEPGRFLSELTATFAAVYLADARTLRQTIRMIHAVTGPSALRPILPHVRPATARATLAHAWHACAALYSAFALPFVEPERAEAPSDVDALIDASIEARDEHAIKFTEVCLREHALAPNPVYLIAAADAARRLG